MERPANLKWFEPEGAAAPAFLAELREAREEALSDDASELLLGVQSRALRFLARSEGDADGYLVWLCCLEFGIARDCIGD
jgi:hypothetical protein